MKSDFMIALTQLAAERNLSKEVIIKTVEAALVSAFKKDSFDEEQNVSVRIAPQSGEVKVYVEKVVVNKVTDPLREISLKDAQKLKRAIQVSETIDIEATPKNAGRIAAQAAKQVVMQRLREAERDAIFGEYATKEGELVSGTIQRIESREILITLGRAEAVLPFSEQVSTEHYRVGQRLRLYLKDVLRSGRGPQLVVSRSHPNLLRRLLELEIPEMQSGTVELKAIARESGQRSKIAVTAHQERVDPVGCCVGLRGIRIQSVTRELGGEKIDITQWDPSPAVFIANALSPAQVLKVEVNENDKAATVIVPDKQFSLAIGKEGQNARLAAKLTGWRIDIKSDSAAEAEARAVAPTPAAVEEAAPPVEPDVESVSLAEADEVAPVADAILETAPQEESVAEEAPETVPVAEEASSEVEPETVSEEVELPDITETLVEAQPASGQVEPSVIDDQIFSILDHSMQKIGNRSAQGAQKPQLRFAEDLGHRQPRSDDRDKKKKGKKKVSAKPALTFDEDSADDIV